MSSILKNDYVGRVDLTDPNYPWGKGQNRLGSVPNTGTPFDEKWFNDFEGNKQAYLRLAGIVPSGTPDNAVESDQLEAIKRISNAFLVGTPVGSFRYGFDFTSANDVGIANDGTFWKYSGTDPYPVTVAEDTDPTTGDFTQAFARDGQPNPVGSFSDVGGVTFNFPNDVARDANGEYWSWTGSLPYTAAQNTVPSEPNYSKRLANVAENISNDDGSTAQDTYDALKATLIAQGLSGNFGFFAKGFTYNLVGDVGIDVDGTLWGYRNAPTSYQVIGGTIPSDNPSLFFRVSVSQRTNASSSSVTQPNLINGGIGNRIDPTTSGSTIGGGGGTTESTLNRIGEDGDGRAIVSTIGGGYDNEINCQASTIAGGAHSVIDTVEGHSLIAGGSYNSILGQSNYSAIWSGTHSTITDASFSCIGGSSNTIDGSTYQSGNPAVNDFSAAILSGRNNNISGVSSTIYGGYSVISGGSNHSIKNLYSAIVGGFNCSITGSHGIAGGYKNTVRRNYSIGFGYQNDVGVAYSFVAGQGNSATEITPRQQVFCFGKNSTITDCDFATILNAEISNIEGDYSAIITGNNNSVTGNKSAIISGISNSVESEESVILAGAGNLLTHNQTSAHGQNIKSYNTGEKITGNGQLRAQGDCQRATNILRQKTVGAEVKRLTPDGGSGTTHFIPEKSTVTIRGNLTAKRSIGSGISDRVVWDIFLVVSKGGAGTSVTIDLNEVTEKFASTATKPTFTIKPETIDAVKFEVTGVTGENWDFGLSIFDELVIVDSI
jgi:hypothetical protein|tara:strand:+ start:671 stop:2992 length:2322 start_codon:yes stop_codon:yes gene_type:complete